MNKILNFIFVAKNILFHSFRTAAPCWAAIVLAAAVLIIRFASMKKNEKKQGSNYGMEGMSLGMCFGLLITTALGDHIGIGLSLGALIGLTIGLCVLEKPKHENK